MGDNVVLTSNCRRNFYEIRLVSIQQVISLESYLKIDHHGSKLLSVEMFNIISNLQSNITTKWVAGN